jgi:hypothetical protein
MTDTLLDDLAALLVLDPQRLRPFFIDSGTVDLAREADREIAAAKASGTWENKHYRAVLERAKARAAAAAAAEQAAPAPAEGFLAKHPELRTRLAKAGSRDASVVRVMRAMGGLARSLERTLPRNIPEAERRLDVRREGARVLVGWHGSDETIDLLSRARIVSREHAEVDARLAGELAKALAAAVLRGDDVLPGLAPEGFSGNGGCYRRLPSTVAALTKLRAKRAAPGPATFGSGDTGPGVDGPPPLPPESLLEMVEAAVGSDLPAATTDEPLVCGAPARLPAAFRKQRLEPFLARLSGGPVKATRAVKKRLGSLLEKRMRIAVREDKKVAALLAVNLQELSRIEI